MIAKEIMRPCYGSQLNDKPQLLVLPLRPDAVYLKHVTVTPAHMIHKLVTTRKALNTEAASLNSAVESRANAVK